MIANSNIIMRASTTYSKHPGPPPHPQNDANANENGNYSRVPPRKIEPQASYIESTAPPSTVTIKDKKQEPLENSPDLITTVHDEPHVVLVKRTPLLLIVLIIMIVSGFGTFLWVLHEVKLGYPPTEYSQIAYGDTLFALLSLTMSCILTIIVIRHKVHHLVIGYLVMFLFVVTFYFSLKAASRAYWSIYYDDIDTIEQYVFANNKRSQGELPQFFHRLQQTFECCGTNTVDKMKDWPERLQTDSMPRSCCKNMWHSCGRLLARTYNYNGSFNLPMRIPSGHFVSMSETEMDGLIISGKPIKVSKAPGDKYGSDTVLKVAKKFYFKKLEVGYPPGTPPANIKKLVNDIIEPYDVDNDQLPTSIGCREEQSIEKVTTIGWEIQQLLDYETSLIHLKSASYQKIAWKIPTCKEIAADPPFHVASNYKREILDPRNDIKYMWYISQGITENYLLKDLIWEKPCESEDSEGLIPNLPVAQWIIGDRNRVGSVIKIRFFITVLNDLMTICLEVVAVVAILLFIVFLIFWKYYSRMKLEEYANLPYPPEFVVLKVRQCDLYQKRDRDEYDKMKSKLLKERDEEEEAAKADKTDYKGIKDEFDRMFVGPPAPASSSKKRRSSLPVPPIQPVTLFSAPSGPSALSSRLSPINESPGYSALYPSSPNPTYTSINANDSVAQSIPPYEYGYSNANYSTAQSVPASEYGYPNATNSVAQPNPAPAYGSPTATNSVAQPNPAYGSPSPAATNSVAQPNPAYGSPTATNSAAHPNPTYGSLSPTATNSAAQPNPTYGSLSPTATNSAAPPNPTHGFPTATNSAAQSIPANGTPNATNSAAQPNNSAAQSAIPNQNVANNPRSNT